MDRAKPYSIPKREVWEAYKRVRANQGAAGIDGQTIADFEADLTNNLYKLWNRLVSGLGCDKEKLVLQKGKGKRPKSRAAACDPETDCLTRQNSIE